MLRLTAAAAGLVAALSSFAPIASAQCPTGIVGFNGAPINDPAASFEMFRIPQFSVTTAGFIVANTAGNNNNSTFRASGFQTEGDAGLETFFDWVNNANPDSWVRLSTFAGAIRPNPSLHTEGKVRFKIKNIGNFIAGRVGICLGIRETGVVAAQLTDGGTTGPIEWVGVSTTPSAITAGLDGVLDSVAAGDDEVRTLAVGSAIVAGLNGVLESTAANDDVVGAGFTYTNAVPAERRPIPAITLNVTAAEVTLEWNLATGVISVNGVPSGGGFAAMTGDGDLSAPNNRGVLEHLAITVNTGTRVRFIMDELQFESPASDPLLAPTVASPIIANDTTVRVTGINSCINLVSLLRNDVVILTQVPSPNTDVIFTLPAPAVSGDVYTATQRDSQSGQTGPPSLPVTVTSGPPAYGMSFALDEDGNGSQNLGWEFVGVTALTSRPDGDLYPDGAGIFTNSAVWQTIDFDLTNPNLVIPWLGGDGDVDPSPIGLYTFDSVWFNVNATANLGPHEVFIDAVEILDAGDNVLQTIHSFEDGRNFLSNTRGQSTVVAPTVTALSTAASYDGRTSRRLVWTFPSVDAQQSLGQLFREGAGAGPATHIQFTDDGTKIRFHIVARGAPINALPLPVVLGPIVQGTVNIRVQNDAAATATQLYIDGVAVGAPVAPVAGFTNFLNVTVAAGESVSATQTIGGIDSDFAYPKAVLAAAIPPATPTIQAPVEDGDTTVDVAGVSADTTLLEILNGATVIGSIAVSNPGPNVAIPISGALQHLQSLSVRATNAAGSSTSPPAAALEVGIGNGEIYVCIGVRENNDPGPLGSPATIGSATTIEWIGAATAVGGAPIGVPLTPSNNWVTLTFDPVAGPRLGFTGNGIIDVPRGTLEHLAVTMNPSAAGRSSGMYTIYVDNVYNLMADGGPDFLLTDFESFTIGQEVMFQEPPFSGSTAANMTPTPASSSVSADEGNPGQSLRLQCFFRDTAANRWARITTSSTVNPLRNPIIDLTHPIRLDLLLLPSGTPQQPGDVDGDGDVDLSDLAALLATFGLCSGDPTFNPGADFDGTGCIELGDLTVLLANFGS